MGISKALNILVQTSLAIVTFMLLILYKATFYILGLFLQPLAILFSREDKTSIQDFSQYPEHGKWFLRTAPKWLFPFGNERDGFLGDKRGWWANECGGKEESFLSQYIWSATRNPCNNLRFMPLSSCNVKEATIGLVAGQEYVKDKVGCEGWQFVKAVDSHIPYYGFYLVKPRKASPTNAIVIRIGFKIEPRHTAEYLNTEDEPYGSYYKGMTFRVSFNKDIS